MPLRSMEKAMHEFKAGTLHSGKGGPVVTSRKQAVAIGMSAERRGKRRRKFSSSDAADALERRG